MSTTKPDNENLNGKSRLEGKVAIITGAARGQGECEARLFVAEGAKVLLADVLDEEGQAVADDICAKYGGGDGGAKPAIYQHLDVSKESDWLAAVQRATDEFGPPNVLVNNAAILNPATIQDTTEEAYMQVIRVNQLGTFLGMKSVYSSMLASGVGSVVNISSVDGYKSANSLISYTAAKFAIRGMTKTAAIEWGRNNIRVNSVHPGGVNTLMGNPISDPILETEPYKLHAIPRIGEPIEVARAVVFLASDEASYITGTELLVDGGWMAGELIIGLPGTEPTGTGYN